MAAATTLLEEACTSGIACLDKHDLLVVIAQSLSGAAACSISTTELPNGTDGTPYSQTIQASPPGATFAVTAGALPDGLTLHADGTIDGTPTLANPYTFTVTATPTSGEPCSREFTITIIPAEPPVFEPPQLADLVLWVKPETLSALSDNDPVTLWPDSGIQGHDLNNTAGNPPTYLTGQIGGQPGVVFNGVNTKMDVNVATTSVAYTVFLVVKFDSAVGTESVVRVGENGGYGLLKDTDNRGVLHRNVALCSDAAATTSAELWTAVRTSGPDLLRFFVNGVAQPVSNDTSSVIAPDGIIHVGRFSAAGLYFAGVICETAVYEVPLSDPQILSWHNYLLPKFSL